MVNSNNSRELKQNRERFITASLIALLFHSVLFLSFILIPKQIIEIPEVITVLKVSLVDFSSNSNSEKQIQAKTEKKGNNSQREQSSFKQKKSEQQNNSTARKSIDSKSPSTEINDNSDIINESIKKSQEKTKQIEEDFFADNSNNQDTLPDTDLNDLFNSLETNIKNQDNNLSSGKGNIDGKDNETIRWGTGKKRALKNSYPILLPNDLISAGLKFVIQINFTVNPDGIIISSFISQGSGNSRWDEAIRTQFNRWSFERSNESTSNGSISIEIGY